MFLATLVWLVLQHKQLVWIVSYNIGMACVTTQTVGLNCFFQHWYGLCYNTNSLVWNCFLQHWYGLCYNTNSWSELFLATLIWLVLQHKQLLWNVSCNIGMTFATTHTVALKCFLQHRYDLCYNTNSYFEMFLATLVWLVLQHNQLLWNVSCNIGMACVTTQTVGLNCFWQHWYDLCYNTNSSFELIIATLVWLVLQHKQLVWIISCKIGMTCVTTQTCWVWIISCNNWYGLCYNINSWVWIGSCNIGMTWVTTQTVALNCFLQLWYWLVLQHKQLVGIVSYNIGMTCVTTHTVALKYFLQHWYALCYNTNSCFEMFLTTLVWLVLQHKQLFWNVSFNIGMACVTTQTAGLNCFLQHWYDLCYNTNSRSELFFASLIWLVLQHKQLLWNVSCNIGMTCVTTQTFALKCFFQHWYCLCCNTNSWSELFLAILIRCVPTVCVVTQVISMMQKTIQTDCLCCNTSHTNVARNNSDQLFVL